MNKRDVIEQIILEHWVEKWDDRKHPSVVKCCYPGCEWRGRFPGDIAEHNTDLIMEALNEPTVTVSL